MLEASKRSVLSKCSTHGYYILRTSCILKPRICGSFRDLNFPRKSGKSMEFAMRCPLSIYLYLVLVFGPIGLLDPLWASPGQHLESLRFRRERSPSRWACRVSTCAAWSAVGTRFHTFVFILFLILVLILFHTRFHTFSYFLILGFIHFQTFSNFLKLSLTFSNLLYLLQLPRTFSNLLQLPQTS